MTICQMRKKTLKTDYPPPPFKIEPPKLSSETPDELRPRSPPARPAAPGTLTGGHGSARRAAPLGSARLDRRPPPSVSPPVGPLPAGPPVPQTTPGASSSFPPSSGLWLTPSHPLNSRASDYPALPVQGTGARSRGRSAARAERLLDAETGARREGDFPRLTSLHPAVSSGSGGRSVLAAGARSPPVARPRSRPRCCGGLGASRRS